MRECALAFLLAAVSMLATPAHAHAQSAGSSPPRLEGFLPPDHWARLALRRAAASGIGSVASISGLRSARISDMREALAGAADSAAAESEGRSTLISALTRLDADHGTPSVDGLVFNILAAAGGFGNRGDRVAGLSVRSATGFEYTRPPVVPDSTRLIARVSGFAGLGPVVAGFDVAADAGVRQLDLSVRAGPLDIRFGRQPLAFGPGTDEGVILGPRASFDGLGLATPDPFLLPSFFGKLGGVQASLLIARMDASGDIVHPWFAAGRIAFAPSRSWVVGLNRAAIFGGEGNMPITAKRLLLVLFAETDNIDKDSDFENQVASVDIAMRLGGPLALLAYIEYGFDDAGLSFFRVPGIIAGIEANRIPGLDRVAIGAELTGFGGSCCGHPAWYRHGLLASGWSDGGRLLGHALGGHGAEAALTWRLDPTSSGFLASGRAFIRDRHVENVYAPDWLGRSAGGRFRFSWPLSGRLRLEGTGEFEGGAGWQRWRTELALGGWLR